MEKINNCNQIQVMGQTFTVQTNILLDFQTSNRGKLWKVPKPSGRSGFLSWGRKPQILDKTKKNQTWNDIIKQDTTWTHMLTINIDPKIQTYSNDSKALKNTLKTFFRTYSHLYTKLALVVEEGNGKWHAHALIRTTRAPTLEEIGINEFSRNHNKKSQKAFFLIKINDRKDQMACSTQWMGDSKDKFPDQKRYNHGGYPYLRKEASNRHYCYLSV